MSLVQRFASGCVQEAGVAMLFLLTSRASAATHTHYPILLRAYGTESSGNPARFV